MLFGESGAIGLMAFRAECNKIIFQEMVRLGGAMRIMAVETSLLQWIMLKFNFCNGVPQFLMAAEAEFIARFEKIILIIRPVSIMAFHTVAFHSNLVSAFCFLGNDILMTLEANLIRILG
jgi:hypothetical protein